MTKTFSSLFAVCIFLSASAAESTLTIEAGKPVAKVSPRFFGLMTEEINYSYDGGLYAELVRNRAFLDDPEKPAHWSMVQQNGASAVISLDSKQPLNAAIQSAFGSRPGPLQLPRRPVLPTAVTGVSP